MATSVTNWPALFRAAVANRAVAPLWRELRTAPVEIPREVADDFGRLAMVSDFQMTRLEAAFRALLAAYRAEEIPCLALKGAAIAVRFGIPFAERPMGDLDLMVPAGAAARARELARSLGWNPGPFEDQLGFYTGHHHLPPLVDGAGSGTSLEIHTDLFASGHPFAITAEDCWRMAEPVPTDAGEIHVLPMRAMIAHLVIHQAWSHQFRGGGWRTWHDLHLLARATGDEWTALVAFLRDARAGTCWYWVARVGINLAGCPLPPETLVEVRPPLPGAFLTRLERHLTLQLLGETPCPSRGLERVLWRTAFRPRRSGHGNALPWNRDAAFTVAGIPPGSPAARPSRLAHLAGTASYCVRVLRDAPRRAGADA